MKVTIILFIIAITTFFGCSSQQLLSEKDCAHSHICCDINCYCCPELKHPLLYSSSKIATYVKTVNELKNQNGLDKRSYPDMSACGDRFDGYYLNKKLVLVDATITTESGCSSKKFYIDQGEFVEIVYQESFPEWNKYNQNYPSERFESDSSKMTYIDTVYTISFTTPKILAIKQSGNKIISREADKKLIEQLVKCGDDMKHKLTEINQ